MKLKYIILYDNHEYKLKLDLGKRIYEIINNREVHQQSLKQKTRIQRGVRVVYEEKCKVVTSKHYLETLASFLVGGN